MPSLTRAWGAARVMSVPRIATVPALLCKAPISVRSSVVLPMPLWPRMPTDSPSAMVSVMSRSTGMAP